MFCCSTDGSCSPTKHEHCHPERLGVEEGPLVALGQVFNSVLNRSPINVRLLLHRQILLSEV